MIEENMLKKIKHLRREYRRKNKKFNSERVKLQKYIEKCLYEYDIQNDAGMLKEIAEILPDCKIRNDLLECLHDLRLEERETLQEGKQDTVDVENGRKTAKTASYGNGGHFKGNVSEKTVLNGIMRLSTAYLKKEREFSISEKELQKYVEGYLNENNAWNDIRKLDEVINVLPGGIQRFWLLDRKFDLIEKAGEQQCVQEAAEIRNESDASQPSEDTQTTGMGGMTF